MTKITLRRASLAQVREMALRSEIFCLPASPRGASHGRHGQAGSAAGKGGPRAPAGRKKTYKI